MLSIYQQLAKPKRAPPALFALCVWAMESGAALHATPRPKGVSTLCIPPNGNRVHLCHIMSAIECTQAGEQWTTGLPDGDEHALMVARLRHEAASRQALLAELQRTRAKKVGRQGLRIVSARF